MKNKASQRVLSKHLFRCLLIVVIALLLVTVLLPFAGKRLVNGVVLPHLITDPKIPLESGCLERLTYSGLTVANLVFDAGNGVYARADRVVAAYSPRTLFQRTVPWMHTRMVLDPYDGLAAEINVRDIYFRNGIQADVTAQCDRMSYGSLSAGPFCATSHLFGTKADLVADIPLQGGLLNARVDLHADWTTNPVWAGVVRIPLSDINDVHLSGLAIATLSGSSSGTLAVVSLTVDQLEIPANSLILSNLQTSCTTKLSGELRSKPAQELTVNSLSVGKMRMENIRMHY